MTGALDVMGTEVDSRSGTLGIEDVVPCGEETGKAAPEEVCETGGTGDWVAPGFLTVGVTI